MTQAPSTAPKIIVVAEEEAYDLLAGCGALWDVQHRVASVAQMWDDLSGSRLDQQSVALVFSCDTFAQTGELEAAIGTLAPFAATFLISWDAARTQEILAGVRAFAAAQGHTDDLTVHTLQPDSKRGLLDTLRATLGSGTVQFPDDYHCDTSGPLVLGDSSDLSWEHQSHQEILDEAPPVPAVAPPAPHEIAAVGASPGPEPDRAPTAGRTAQELTAEASGEPVPASAQQDDPLDRPIIENQFTMAVTSSKGGSGKSTTAMMTAAAIAQSSRKAFEAGLIPRPLRVVLVDMDTRDGQVASLIGKYMPTALNVRVAPRWDEETILANLVHNPKMGIDALLAPVRPRTADDVGPDFYRHVIRMLKTTHDVVIMDTSVNYLDPLISTVCLPESTAILFVTTLATTSVQGMARALREVTEPVEHGGMGIKRSKIGIVVNQSITEVGMDREQLVQASLRVPIVGAIPLATKDVLICTNYNRMHQLLKHPLLGPAYFKLAQTCLRDVPLVPLIEGTGAPAVPPPVAGGSAAAEPVPVPVGAGAGPGRAAAHEEKTRRGLFGRKG